MGYLLSSLMVICISVAAVDAAAHVDVIAAGPTVPPGFKRIEGKPPIPCPSTHPFACGGAHFCSQTQYKPNNGSMDCDGGLLTVYSQCCPENTTACPTVMPGVLCKDNPEEATFCPASHPIACASGDKCTTDAFKPASGGSDCDGGVVYRNSTCCPASTKTKDCRTDSGFKCKSNRAFGYLCPVTNPYPCNSGRQCAKSPFKPLSGPAADCDGKRLDETSVCCPVSDLVDCNGNATRYQCKANPPSRVIVYSDDNHGDRFNFFDLHKECISPVLHLHPEKVSGRSMGSFAGKAVTCSGTFQNQTPSTSCHYFNRSLGWVELATLQDGAYAGEVFALDEGTSSETLYFGGGVKNWTGSQWTNAIYQFDGISSFPLHPTWSLPVKCYDHEVRVVDLDRIVFGVGRWLGPNEDADQFLKDVYIYTRSTSSWTNVASLGTCGSWNAMGISGQKLYVPCYGTTDMAVVDLETYGLSMQSGAVLGFTLKAPYMPSMGKDLFMMLQVEASNAVGTPLVTRFENSLQSWRLVGTGPFTFAAQNSGRPGGAIIIDDKLQC